MVCACLRPWSEAWRNSSRFNKEFAKIKKMETQPAHFLLLLALMAPALARASCGDDTTAKEEAKMVERINQRYDDFFSRQHELEADRERREKESGEIKELRQQIVAEHEKARADYVKNRKKAVVDPRLEKEWNESEMAWKEQNKMARNCFVRSRDAVRVIEKKGRRIPGNREYDLDE